MSEKSETKSVNQQLSEAEKDLETKLQALKADYQNNILELNKEKIELNALVKKYEGLLTKDVELSITIAQYEEILNGIRMKRNPSFRL